MVVDPFSKETGLTPPRFRADLVLVTHDHYDHSNAESLTGTPFIIKDPGEYEVKGVYVKGIQTFHDKSKGKERGVNTIYQIKLEDMSILHMGDFGEGTVGGETLDEFDDVDILMIPVGGKYTIDGEEAAKVVKEIEPKVVIPMHYKITGLKLGLDGVETFLKEMGASKIKGEDKLTIKKKDLGEDGGYRVIVLNPV